MDLIRIKEFSRPFLSSIHREDWCFSYFTAHDSSHAEEVWNISKKITEEKISTFEKLLLQAACFCHDIGMANYNSDDNIRRGSDGEYCDHVRKNHHRRSEVFINTFKEDMGLTDQESYIIGKLCYSHSSKADLNDLNESDPVFNGVKIENVRTKLLASILRISDALDASKDRLPSDVYIQDAPSESKHEYIKHAITKKVTIDSEKILIELSDDHKIESESVKNKFIEEFSSVEETLNAAGLVSVLDFEYINTSVDSPSFVPKDVERIMELYVKPSCFEEISEKLEKHNIVIISGNANVGKTSTANYIAGLYWKEEKRPVLILKPEMKFRHITNYTIIIDDAFGESKFENKFASISYNDIIQFKEENKVIITSREHVLGDAVLRSRIGEVDYNNWKLEIEQEGSYDDDSLKEILYNHVKYYKKIDKIGRDEVKLAKNHAIDIISELRFPHNIDIFVKEKLKEINEGKNLKDALDESKHIKRVAKNWFLSLDDTQKFFIFTAWLFPTKIEFFKEIYPEAINVLKRIKPSLEIEDLNELIKSTNSYIEYEEFAFKENKIHFRHPNYREGINEAIRESFEMYIESLGPLFQFLYRLHTSLDFKKTVTDGLKRIASINPNWAFNLLKELVSDENSVVKRQIALVLGELGHLDPDESMNLLKVLASDTNWEVREYVAESLVFGIDDLTENQYFLEESYKLLKKLALDENYYVQAKVAEVLGKFGYLWPDESIDLLKKLSKVNDCIVRSKVAESLGKFGFLKPDQSLDLLENLADDKKFWKVRKEVINALFICIEHSLQNEEDDINMGLLKKRSSLKILEKLVYDKDWRVKKCLGEALVIGLVDPVNSVCFGSNDYIVMLHQLVDNGDCRIKVAIIDTIMEFGYLINTECEELVEKIYNDGNDTIHKICECDTLSRMLEDNSESEYYEIDNFSEQYYN